MYIYLLHKLIYILRIFFGLNGSQFVFFEGCDKHHFSFLFVNIGSTFHCILMSHGSVLRVGLVISTVVRDSHDLVPSLSWNVCRRYCIYLFMMNGLYIKICVLLIWFLFEFELLNICLMICFKITSHLL